MTVIHTEPIEVNDDNVPDTLSSSSTPIAGFHGAITRITAFSNIIVLSTYGDY